MAEILNNFELYLLQNDFYLEIAWTVFFILSCSAFNSTFLANVANFLSNLALFMNPEIAALSTKFLLFIWLAIISLVNSLWSAVGMYLLSMPFIFAS